MLNRITCVPAGKVIEAKFATHAPKFARPTKQTGNRRVGVLYEKKAQGYLLRKLEKIRGEGNPHISIKASPWIVFRSEGDAQSHVRYCQPDCLIFDDWERRLIIVEIKLQHCTEAYNQVRKLYEPVINNMYPNYGIAAVELVQWHDPHITFPETYYFEPDLFQAQINRFAIHIWNPRYDKLSALPTQQNLPTPPPS
jgi:hypothetical protein